ITEPLLQYDTDSSEISEDVSPQDDTIIYPDRNFFFNFNFLAAFPQSIYDRYMHHNGFGLGFGFYSQIKKDSPFYLGFSGNYLSFDRLTLHFDDYPTEVTRTNQWLWVAQVRYMQRVPWKFIQPYAEGYIGIKSLATRTTIGDSDTNDTEYKRHSRDMTYTFGLGAGCMIPIMRGLTADIQLSYLLGGFARYHSLPRNVDPNQFDYGIDAFTLNHSITDIMLLKIGVSALIY
ncbi:MAG: hypothetical protein ABIV51_03330, partial [Saprospiraceae bacterium]